MTKTVHGVQGRAEGMKDVCQKCHKHKATLKWLRNITPLTLAQDEEDWCECCCRKAQLEHAQNWAARIPELEEVLATCNCEEESHGG